MGCTMPQRLAGKVAIVTAATAGIGKAIAQRLAEEGASVMICSRRKDNVEEAVTELRSKGLEVSGAVCHVGDASHRKQLIEKTLSVYGAIDILVSNAAVNPTAGPILSTPPEALDKLFDINVKSAILLAAAAVKHMKAGSSIVFISSITAFNPPFPIGAYGLSKTALLGLTKGLSQELGPQGITVNCVAPGFVPTKFSAALLEDKQGRAASEDATALKRLGTPEDMAAAVAFLVSGDASYITGETLVVAGGHQSSSRL